MAQIDTGVTNFTRLNELRDVLSFPLNAKALTPSNVDTYSAPIAVYVGVAGNVAVMPWDSDTAVTFLGMPAGAVVPVLCRQVMATNTTATDLVGIY